VTLIQDHHDRNVATNKSICDHLWGLAIIVLGIVQGYHLSPTMPPRLPPLPLQTAAKPIARADPAPAKPASAPMTEAMIEQLVAKGKPDMSDWVAALQDTGTDKSTMGFAKKDPATVVDV
jgi:hypothetical protein